MTKSSIVLSGATLVLPDRLLSPGTLVIEEDRIAEIRPDAPSSGAHSLFAFHNHFIVPGFVDVHVHGVEGVDTLDGGGAVATIAASLPRYGVTAFCPTTVACDPAALGDVLAQVQRARGVEAPRGARVLRAHLESNFISPEYCGAQPPACLRSPRSALEGGVSAEARSAKAEEFTGADILRAIESAAADVGIVTMAPELDGGLDLVRRLTALGARVSLGHSGATFEEAMAAITAGAVHATHLFNRMPPLEHRAPGLAGAVLQADEVAAELICDGVHVHPAVMRMAIASKRPSRVMAITDGTAAAGLPVGARARLGGRQITAGASTAELADGTLAGSIVTMDRAFRLLVESAGVSLVDAAHMCATTPALEMGLPALGRLAPGSVADLAVLDSEFAVVQTYVGGQLVYARAGAPAA